jgi:ubiquinone/menaquinone biosynthesis C-methylase UbiE
MTGTAYAFDTADVDECVRLEAQTSLWDPFTFRRLDEVGVRPGWRCLEVGAGTGSVARWLLGRVGTDGHVVATDLEPKWFGSLAGPNCEVRRHDIATDPIEEAEFDLVHLRLVLMHLPARAAVVEKLVRALRPGGWLVIDDYDLSTIGTSHPANAAWATVSSATSRVLESRGADTEYGRKLADALLRAGLDDVTTEGMLHLKRAADASPWVAPVFARLRADMVASGAATADEVDTVLAELSDPASKLSVFSPLLVSASGRRA